MNILIVAGLMAFGLLAIIAAVLLAIDENKTVSPGTSSITEITTDAPVLPTASSTPATIAKQQLLAIREEAQVISINSQFSELTSQLRDLHEQVRAIEHRLSVLADMAEKIEFNQSKSGSEETDGYPLLEPVSGTHA